MQALLDGSGLVVELAATAFPVALPYRWVSVGTSGAQVGWTYNGTTWTAPAALPGPTPTEIAAAVYATFIAGGLTVTSTGTSALNGVYALDETTQSDIAVEAQFISTFSEFTNGGTVNLQWPLQNGTLVSFPTTAEFLALAKASGQVVAAAKLAAGQGSAMPVATATIP